MLWSYIKWCWRLKSILRWEVRLVDDRPLSQEEYEFPEHIEITDDMKKKAIPYA